MTKFPRLSVAAFLLLAGVVYALAQGFSGIPAANLIFAGPSSGPAAAGRFRAMVGSDLPALGGGDVSCTSGGGNCTIANGAVTNGKITGPISVANGGTNSGSASGTALDNITGFASTGFLKRTGAGAYSFIADPLPVANGGTADTGTAWTTFTSSPTCGNAVITTNSSKSKTLGKTTWVEIDFTIAAAIGTCTNSLTWTLPLTSNSAAGFAGRELAVNGKGFNCGISGSGQTTTLCAASDATNFAASSHLVASGVYENQ